MSLEDNTIQCSDCGVTFTFSVDEQEHFRSTGYTNEPKRCPACRQASEAERNVTDEYDSTHQTPSTAHEDCSKDTALPFKHRSDSFIYCLNCCRKINSGK